MQICTQINLSQKKNILNLVVHTSKNINVQIYSIKILKTIQINVR